MPGVQSFGTYADIKAKGATLYEGTSKVGEMSSTKSSVVYS